MTSIIIKVPDSLSQLLDRVLAYVVSFEKIFGTENLVIRVTEIKKYDWQVMSNYSFEPHAGINYGSLIHAE